MKGNCVDKFLVKRIDEHVDNLILFQKSISDRISLRDAIIDYFSDGCYEKDFADIIRLRNEAKTIVENCNKFLERISEQYSKLN